MNFTNIDLGRVLVMLGCAGLELCLHPTDHQWLRFRPAGLPPALRDVLRVHKQSLLGLLASGYRPVDIGAAYLFEERLGVAQDLGMEVHSGAPAWLIAVGEAMREEGLAARRARLFLADDSAA